MYGYDVTDVLTAVVVVVMLTIQATELLVVPMVFMMGVR